MYLRKANIILLLIRYVTVWPWTWAQMMGVCPLQVCWSSVHAPLRTFYQFGISLKFWRRKCAKSSITLQRIVRFCSNFTQSLNTWRPNDQKKFNVNGSKAKVIAWHDVLAWKNRHISWTDSWTEFKLCANYHTAKRNTWYMFKVKGQRSRSRGQSSRSHYNVTYKQWKPLRRQRLGWATLNLAWATKLKR